MVVNLDRRPDRLALVRRQLEALRVPYLRFPAVDGRSPAVAAAWRTYAALPLREVPTGAEPLRGYRDFYLGDAPPALRVAFLEQRERRKAITTPGAWGLLASMTAVVERALSEGWPSLLILEDDVLFHRDAEALFARAHELLPADWAIFQLGALQHHWEPGWIDWQAPNLYRCNGSSIAAHAVGLRREVLADLLERCRRRDLPFDIGALQEVKRRYRTRCFTCFPNIAIQDGRDTEIAASTRFFAELAQDENVYRWRLEEYGPPLLRLRARTRRLARRVVRLGKPPPPAAPVLEPAAADHPVRTAGLPSPPFPLPALRPYLSRRPDAKGTALVLLVGAEPTMRARIVPVLARQLGQGPLIPVVITDDPDFTPLRAHRLPFEYLPAAPSAEDERATLPWDTYRLRRLALWRRKWQPARILAFGEPARTLLDRWRRSPFEADLPGPDLGDPAASRDTPGRT